MVQGDVCHVRFVEDVHYTHSIEHAHSSVTSLAEQPTCPVCLGMPSCPEHYIFFTKNNNKCSVQFGSLKLRKHVTSLILIPSFISLKRLQCSVPKCLESSHDSCLYSSDVFTG